VGADQLYSRDVLLCALDLIAALAWGARTPASLLLMFYAAVTILYFLWLRFRQQLR
jgi:hypothetical protein